MEDLINKIKNAKVYDVADRTPLDAAPMLSERLANRVLLKREDLQPVFSFKLRGAYNRIAQLTDDEKKRGVIAASAGNHAQGVALSARRLGINALIVMPNTTPLIKVQAVKNRGAEVVLFGDAYDEAYKYAQQLAEKEGRTFVHPYDDWDVIAGQGTIAVELLEQVDTGIDAIFVPVGGGGLIAGVSAYIKHVSPETKVIGVEPQDAPSMHAALAAGERVVLEQVGIFADGVAVRQAGERPFEVARQYVDEVILVSTDEICAAIKDIYDDTRSITEPAGALGVAGLKRYVEATGVSDQTLIAIDSGANINFDRLRYVSERAEVGERREALVAVTIPEEPGSFLRFCRLIGNRSVTEFNYRFSSSAEAHVFVGIEMYGKEEEKIELIRQLDEGGYRTVDMTDNEVAKTHIRFMVGGHPPGIQDEILYRFQFPERPGALLRFLSSIGSRWNISLFHYRNHGAAYGRVLVGVQVPAEQRAEFQTFLDELGYVYFEEKDNPAYQLFLA